MCTPAEQNHPILRYKIFLWVISNSLSLSLHRFRRSLGSVRSFFRFSSGLKL